MEQLNRVELRGRVVSVNIHCFEEARMARISLVTDYAYKLRNGDPAIESTWHNVIVWEGKTLPDLNILQAGIWLHIYGRIRQNTITSPDGSTKRFYDIVASSLNIETEKAGIPCA